MSRLGTAYLRAIQAVGRRLPYGTNVFERSWDVLVVLDGCRADLLAAVADDYDSSPKSARSARSAVPPLSGFRTPLSATPKPSGRSW